MKDTTIKTIFIVGLILMWVGVVGEVIYYGIEFEMLVLGGLTAMSVAGGVKVWGK